MLSLARLLLAGLLTFAVAVPAQAASGLLPRSTVYLARNLTDLELITLGSALAKQPQAVLLLDTDTPLLALSAYLASGKPERIVPIGRFSEGVGELQRRLGVKVDMPIPWSACIPSSTEPEKRPLVRSPGRVVVCPATPRRQLLQAACLAGLEGESLWVLEGKEDEPRRLAEALRTQRIEHVTLVGSAGAVKVRSGTIVLRLANESTVAASYLRRLGADTGKITTAIVCNPSDTSADNKGFSALGPWLAVRKQAALLLTNSTGTNVEEIVGRRSPAFRHQLDSVILLADLKAIPMQQRPNPIPGDKDPHIDLEPLTPAERGPISYAIGRLFHAERAVVPLMLARQSLLAGWTGPRRALVASNPGGGLSLLETLSRTTARELENVGYRTSAMFGKELTGPILRKAIPEADLFLWEGHHNTLVKEWGFPTWDEPLPPSFVFLQSCLALQEEKAGPLLGRGAIAVVGTSTRTYSGSGGAFSLAYFDALVHEHQSLGGSLRQAKNFLVAYSLLKEKRLGAGAQRTGANIRATWAFTLWGDPTLRLPEPPVPAASKKAVWHEVNGRTLTIHLPEESLGPVVSGHYQARVAANSRLAGLVRKTEDQHPLVPLVFAEVDWPGARQGITPRLRSRLPAEQWVFTWDERRKVGYLLAIPRARDKSELRFHIESSPADVAELLPLPSSVSEDDLDG